MWSSLAEKRKGSPSRASFMQNARVAPGVARIRPGTSAVGPPIAGKVTGIFNWITPNDNDNLVLYQDGTDIKKYRQADGSVVTLTSVPSNTRAPSFADLDVWVYIAGYDTNANGTFPCRVFDGTNTDTAFRSPLKLAESIMALDAGAGYCTKGTHYIGFVYMNRTGFSGRPSTTAMVPVPPATSTYPSLSVPTFPVTAPAGNAPLAGAYDAPNGATVFGPVNFAGWLCCASNRVVGALLYIDGQYCGQSFYGGKREDAAATHPSPDDPYIGFNLVFDTSNLAAGRHSWYEVAVLDDGRKLQLPTVNFDISPGGELPMSVTLSGNGSKVDIFVNVPAQPDGGGDAKLFLIMTRADNAANWYFMPTSEQTGAIGEQPVPYNVATTLHFVANLSDEDMAASLDSANDQFNILSQDANGTGPFNPSYVVAYGQRMCYGDGTILYVSDINNPQQLAADRNAVTMPNQRKIAYAFPLQGSVSLFLVGDHWTAYISDNSDIPATWAQPVNISGTLGAPFPDCVCYRTGGNHAWIVTEAGPYRFFGQFDERPLTYLVSDQWDRVNWQAAYAVKVADDVVNRLLYVAVPLDGATEPTHMFCIDYTNGMQFDQVDISLDKFTPAVFSAIGIVKEPATHQANLWIGPSAAGRFAHFDPSTVNDQGAAIDSFWESGLIRNNEISSSMIRVGAADVWIRGAGVLQTCVCGPEKRQTIYPPLLLASGVPASGLLEKPGIMYALKFDIRQIENFTQRFGTNDVDTWWELSGFRSYFRQDLFNR